MHFIDILTTALGEIRANKLRSFFTLLGIIVSVAFLVAVVAVIQGMNAYVKENVANSLIGTNAFQVRRVPIQLGERKLRKNSDLLFSHQTQNSRHLPLCQCDR